MRRAYKEYMPCQYTLAHDLEKRLYKTVIRYDGEPVMVGATSGDMILLMKFPEYKLGFKNVPANDPLLDISIIETGYFNYKGKSGEGVYYAFKKPEKQWKAGLCNLSFTNIEGNGTVHMYEGMYSEGFRDSLIGVFPDIKESLKMVTDGLATEIAISQDVAFKRTDVGVVFIYYRTKAVGWVAPGETKVMVTDQAYGWVVNRLLTRSGLTV